MEKIPPEVQARIEAMLEQGESVRWCAMANPEKSPEYSSQSFSPYWIIVGIAGFFEVFSLIAFVTTKEPASLIYFAVGLIFTLLALGLRQRDVNAVRAAARLVMVITTKRVFDADVTTTTPGVSLDVSHIAYAEPNRRPDGFGDIEFGCGAPGVAPEDAVVFHHWRGVPRVGDAMKALEKLKRDHDQRLIRVAPDE